MRAYLGFADAGCADAGCVEADLELAPWQLFAAQHALPEECEQHAFALLPDFELCVCVSVTGAGLLEGSTFVAPASAGVVLVVAAGVTETTGVTV